MNPQDKIIVALDVPTLEKADQLLKNISGKISYFKIGKELFTAVGPEAVRLLKSHGCKVFLDLKYHDIPNTVAGAVRSAMELGVDMLNFHTSGGLEMMKAAVRAVEKSANPPLLLAVTILTSLDDQALKSELRIEHTADEQVLHLAKLASQAGVDGVVASPREIRKIREALGSDFIIVTPGIRPEWARTYDQKRSLTPRQALAAGADYIVIGRPITAAADPLAAAEKIIAELV